MANQDVSIKITASDATKGAFASVQRGLGGLKSSALGISAALAGIGAGVSVAGLAAFAKSGIDAADALNDMSLRTGVAVKTLAGFKLAAEQNGTALDGVAKGIQKLTLSIGQAEAGSKEQAAALVQLGVSVKDPQEAFYQLADAVANSNDPIRTNAALQKVLGKNYAELLPLLQTGAQGLRDSAAASATFAEQMAKLAPNADKFNDSMAELKTQVAGASATLLTQLVPSMTDTVAKMNELTREGHGVLAMLRGLAGLGKIPFDLILGDIKPAETAQQRIKELREELGSLERKKAGGNGKLMQYLFGSPEELNQQITVVKNQIAALEKFGDKIYKQKAAPAAKLSAGTADYSAAATSGRSKADPLASLLGSTDIGKLKEFDKTVALLNQRFNFGQKDAELYAQAMTKLVESTFSDNFKQQADAMKEQDETQRLVAEHLKATNDALYEQQQAWTDAGRALEEQMRTPLENANIEFGRLDELLNRGAITWETYSRAVFKLQESLDGTADKAKTTQDTLSAMAEQAGRNIQDSFAEFLFNPFDKGVKGMLQSFGQTLQHMIAQAVAADLAKRIFNWGDSGGGAGSVLGSIASAVFGGARASGGPVLGGKTYLVGERGPELFTPGTGGSITPNNAIAGHTINVYVSGTNNAPDVRRAVGQGMREAYLALQGAQRYA